MGAETERLMKTKKALGRLLLLAGMLVVAGFTADIRVAPISHAKSDGRPIWVSESVAFDSEGNLRSDLFSPHIRTRLDELRKVNGNECLRFAAAPSIDHFLPTDSLAALAAHSLYVVAGEVVSSEKGFYAGNPGTLFHVRVSHHVKRPSPSSIPTAFLFVGDGRIDTARGAICAMTPLHSIVPRVGDRVMFFAYQSPRDVENNIFLAEPHQQIVVQEGDRLHLPRALSRADGVNNIENVIEHVAASVAKDEGSSRKR